MVKQNSAENERAISRDRLADLLNEDLSREYQAIIGYVVYSQVLKGAAYMNCKCPLWCDGELNGKRYRHSLGTRDKGRAGLRLAKLEAPGARQPKPIPEAIEAFHTSVGNLAVATRTKYQRVLRFFSTVGPPPLALPILPHIVPFSVPVRGGQTRITGGMGCSRQLSVNPSRQRGNDLREASGSPRAVELHAGACTRVLPRVATALALTLSVRLY